MKADCMKAGEEQQWPDVLRNKTFTLEYGYYMTLGIATDERKKGIDHEAGRQSERDFFEEKKLWNNEFKERSGTDKLIDTLIEILSSMIKARYIVAYVIHGIKLTFKYSKFEKYSRQASRGDKEQAFKAVASFGQVGAKGADQTLS